MSKKPEYGLLIDYEYCTGCYTCQVACAQEYNWPAGMGGIPGGRFLYVVNIGDNNISVVDRSTNISVRTLPVGQKPLGAITSPDGSFVYVLNSGLLNDREADNVSVLVQSNSNS